MPRSCIRGGALNLRLLKIQHQAELEAEEDRMKPLRILSRREREIMDVVFRAGSATAKEVHEGIPDPPSYSAVRATLRILETKELLRHEFDGKRYVYRPRLARSQARQGAIQHLLTTFFDGSAAGAVMALLDQPGLDLSQDDLDRMARLIENARRENR
jgi:predicted transcriptional regulator